MKNRNNKNTALLIDIDRPYELWDWAAELKVSAERLKQAVQTVGRSVSAVRLFLKK